MPVWTYGVELRGCNKPSNIKILGTYQSRTLRTITGAPRFVSNLTLHSDLKIPFVHQEITLRANKYKLRTTGHSNRPISELYHQSNDVRRRQRIWPEDVAGWFQRTIDGWCLTQDIHLKHYLLILLLHLALEPWVGLGLGLLDNQSTYPRLVVRFLNNILFTG
jgi:hypothetical protein